MTEEKVPEEDTTHEAEGEPDDTGETVEAPDAEPTTPEPEIAPDVPGATIEPTPPAVTGGIDNTPSPLSPEDELEAKFQEHANLRG